MNLVFFFVFLTLTLCEIRLVPKHVQLFNQENKIERYIEFELYVDQESLSLDKAGGILYVQYSDRKHYKETMANWYLSKTIMDSKIVQGKPFLFSVGALQNIRFKFDLDSFELRLKYERKNREKITLAKFTQHFTEIAMDLASDAFRFDRVYNMNPFTWKEMRRIRKGLFVYQKLSKKFKPKTRNPRVIDGWSPDSEKQKFLKEVKERLDEIQQYSGLDSFNAPKCIQLHLGKKYHERPRSVYQFFGKMIRRLGLTIAYLSPLALAAGFVLLASHGFGIIAMPFILAIFLGFVYWMPIGFCVKIFGNALYAKDIGGESYFKLKEEIQNSQPNPYVDRHRD